MLKQKDLYYFVFLRNNKTVTTILHIKNLVKFYVQNTNITILCIIILYNFIPEIVDIFR